MKPNRLKQLQRKQNELNAKREALREEISQKSKEETNLSRELKTLQEQLKFPANPVVTEHALLRYFERVLTHNLDTIRESIVTPELKEQIIELGSGKFPHPNGYTLVVKNGYIVTIEV